MQDPLRAYPNVYDDSFAEASNLPESIPPDQILPESASIDRDNKLLSFHLPTYNFTLLDYSLRRTSVNLSAQLHGMFFMAEAPSTVAAEANQTPPELTCYRRNLFQVTGSITLPRTLRYILTEQGDRIPIVGQELSISATESVNGHPVKLISVPWKTPSSNSIASPEDKAEKEPTSIPLDIVTNQDMDADYATFPIAWKRLQFRIATANNGRRRELQQHFLVRLRVVATLSTGAQASICEAKSGAIIVRGRSPRNFQQKKDFPVGGPSNNNRKSMPPPRPMSRHSSDSAVPHQQPSMKPETNPEGAFAAFNFDQNEMPSPSKVSGWNNPNKSTPQGHPSSAAGKVSSASTPNGSRINGRSSQSSPQSPPPAAPVVLSLTDDGDTSRQRSRTSKAARTSTSSSISRPAPLKHSSLSNTAHFLNTHSQQSFSDTHDSADLLYEYFPLSVDDWQPPVDAVYRPHVVHHMNISQAASAGGRAGLLGRSKRYFSEDQS